MTVPAHHSEPVHLPVVGSVERFADAGRAAGRAAEEFLAVARALDEFGPVSATDVLRGASAHALAERLAAGADGLRQAAALAGELSSACGHHADSLSALRRDAAVAAAATARARDELRRSEQRLAAAVDEAELAAERRAVAWHTAELASRSARLDELADDEHRLVAATAVVIDDLTTALVAAGAPPAACVPPGLGSLVPVALASAAQTVLAAHVEQLAASLEPPAGWGPLVPPWSSAPGGAPWEQLTILTAHAHLHRVLGAQPLPHDGDAGGTYQWDFRGWWEGRPSGTEALVEALTLTDGTRWIAPDEFGVVELAGGRYVVVLPGVTDLSRPALGYHPGHRTVRDVDLHALPSSTSTAIADNRYAQMVAEGLAEFGVPPGSELLLVGHSFGADTALDLAADPGFNGPEGYAVTHVLAAGYHSGPQLGDVPEATRVLVLQNRNDLVIGLERLAEHPVRGGRALADAWNAARDAKPVRALGALVTAAGEVAALAAGAVPDGRGAPLPAPWGTATGRAEITSPDRSQTVVVFDGGRRRAGHHQDHYVRYLTDTRDAAVIEFAADLATAGYTAPGHVFAIDVSVPDPRRQP